MTKPAKGWKFSLIRLAVYCIVFSHILWYKKVRNYCVFIFRNSSQCCCGNIEISSKFCSFRTIFVKRKWCHNCSAMGYCCFCLTIYALLHQDYWSNWLQSQQSLIPYSKAQAVVSIPADGAILDATSTLNLSRLNNWKLKCFSFLFCHKRFDVGST